jgi:hypothetical protein
LYAWEDAVHQRLDEVRQAEIGMGQCVFGYVCMCIMCFCICLPHTGFFVMFYNKCMGTILDQSATHPSSLTQWHQVLRRYFIANSTYHISRNQVYTTCLCLTETFSPRNLIFSLVLQSLLLELDIYLKTLKR